MLTLKATTFAAVLLAATGIGQRAPTKVPAKVVMTQALFAHDPLRHAISLKTGEYGMAILDHRLLNVDSEVDFGAYLTGGLTAGVQGGQIGEFLDLGTAVDLAAAYGFEETVGYGQGFASIHFKNGLLMILQDYASQTFQPFTAGNNFLHSAPPAYSIGVPALPGHIYLVRITDRNDPSFLRFAKLIVVSRKGDESVELTWQMLRAR